MILPLRTSTRTESLMTTHVGQVVTSDPTMTLHGRRVAYVKTPTMKLMISPSGWVRNPNIETGIPLLDPPVMQRTTTGPRTFPRVGELIVFESVNDQEHLPRWCRSRAYRAAARRAVAAYGGTDSHQAQMDLISYLMWWILNGRQGMGPMLQIHFQTLVERALGVGTNPVLVERTVHYFLQHEVDSRAFYRVCKLCLPL